MTLTPGTRLGPYEITGPLGAGGMGEVYRALDTRLERSVAIKVLPADLARNPGFRQRFEREAKAVSSLNHPHICTLHDIGHQDGVDYLVMEYLDGETLAERLKKGPLPPEQALRTGIEIADALDRAHRQGVVHRDLKPGNVMLTRSGAKLLDFGLAKVRAGVAEGAEAAGGEEKRMSALPTAQKELTEKGTVLGTFQYMAPEQLEGKDADARTDIFALGTVLYEMVTGRKAFDGKSQASLIAAILERDPAPMSAVQPMTPPALDRLVRTCLAKDPDERWQSAGDVRRQLQWIAEGGSGAGLPAPVAARRRSRERLWMAGTALFGAAAIVLGVLLFGRPQNPVRMVQSSILPPENCQFNFNEGPMALSPDGTRMAFVGTAADGRASLWVRPLSGLSAQALAGTEGASYPFWSPDGAYVGFFAGGTLKKIAAAGGPAEKICDAPNGRGGAWSREGVIVFAPGTTDVLHQVPAAGGVPKPVTALDPERKETDHRWPFFLPDGRHFLYLARAGYSGAGKTGNRICVGSLEGIAGDCPLTANSNVAYVPPGYVLFWREKILVAQPFDAGSRKVTGEAFPVAEDVRYRTGFSSAIFSASANGTLAYHGGPGVGLSRLTWYDRQGRPLGTVGAPGEYNRPALSHRGDRLAIDIADPQLGNLDIWIIDLVRGTRSRLTFDPANDFRPVWSPDDSRIVFSSSRAGAGDLYLKAAAGTGDEEVLLASGGMNIPQSWSADGRFIAFNAAQPNSKTGIDVWVVSVPDRKAEAFVQSQFTDLGGQFSPDGRWMAYVSWESGRQEVYVRPFPGPGGKWQISTAGGFYTKWRRDGREIVYVAPDGSLWAAEVRAGATFEAGVPRRLFSARFNDLTAWPYDLSADGQRFLCVVSAEEGALGPATLVQNWLAGRAR